MPNLSDVAMSRIRTAVPIGVGWATSAIATALDVEIPAVATEHASGVLGFFAALAYYGVVRKLEEKWPQWGWLLGVPAMPVYNLPPAESETRDVFDPATGALVEVHSVTRWPRAARD